MTVSEELSSLKRISAASAECGASSRAVIVAGVA